MAGKTGPTPLQTAIHGGKVTDKAAQSALGEAVGRIANLTKRAQNSRESMMETGALVVHTAEVQGSLFLSSLAEGYVGEDKLKLGAVDLRAPLGLLAQGWGLYQTMSGERGAGVHVLAIGNGVMGSWLANVARNAGRTLAEKRAGGPVAAAPAAIVPSPMVMMQGAPMLGSQALLPAPALAGPMREVLLTPEPIAEGDDELGRGGRGGHRKRRHKRRQQQDESSEDEEQSLEGDDELGRGGGRRKKKGRFVRAQQSDDSSDE